MDSIVSFAKLKSIFIVYISVHFNNDYMITLSYIILGSDHMISYWVITLEANLYCSHLCHSNLFLEQFVYVGIVHVLPLVIDSDQLQ